MTVVQGVWWKAERQAGLALEQKLRACSLI